MPRVRDFTGFTLQDLQNLFSGYKDQRRATRTGILYEAKALADPRSLNVPSDASFFHELVKQLLFLGEEFGPSITGDEPDESLRYMARTIVVRSLLDRVAAESCRYYFFVLMFFAKSAQHCEYENEGDRRKLHKFLVQLRLRVTTERDNFSEDLLSAALNARCFDIIIDDALEGKWVLLRAIPRIHNYLLTLLPNTFWGGELHLKLRMWSEYPDATLCADGIPHRILLADMQRMTIVAALARQNKAAPTWVSEAIATLQTITGAFCIQSGFAGFILPAAKDLLAAQHCKHDVPEAKAEGECSVCHRLYFEPADIGSQCSWLEVGSPQCSGMIIRR